MLTKDFFKAVSQIKGGFFWHLEKSTDRVTFEKLFLAASKYSVVDLGLNYFHSFYVSDYRPVEEVQIKALSDINPISEQLTSASSDGICSYTLGKVRVASILNKFQTNKPQSHKLELKNLPLDIRTKLREGRYFDGYIIDSQQGDKINISGKVDDEVLILLNGLAIVDMPGDRSSTEYLSKIVAPGGPIHIQVFYANINGAGNFELNVSNDQDQRPVKIRCLEPEILS
jgi:hypothetical protein